MKDYYIHVYNIGQGLCTMLRTEPDGENNYLGIFDCGTLRERNKKAVTDTIAAYGQEYGCINSIVISHQDSDHRSLLLDIIWKFYGITTNEIICQDVFYFHKTRDESTIYERLEDNIIKYSHVREGDGYYSDFSVAVDSNEGIQWFALSRTVDGNPQIGECRFQLSWSNACSEMSLNIYIEGVSVKEPAGSSRNDTEQYDKTFSIPWEEAFFSNQWGSLKSFIGKLGIYERMQEELQGNRHVESRWKRFLDNMDEFKNKFIYRNMHSKLSQTKNYDDQNRSIQKIWLGGDYWEIGYRRLYSVLEKLVKIGLVDNVNGFTRDSAEGSGAGRRMCGLMCVNEETIRTDTVAPSAFIIDNNLVDCVSHKVGDNIPTILHNATSLIVEFDTSSEEKSRRIIYPGDATVHVFEQLANALAGSDVFKSTFFMAPHHGSLRTNYCGGERQPLHNLLDKLTADKTKKLDSCVISALGEVFQHPDQRFVRDMRNYVKQNHPSEVPHSVCYYNGNNRIVENENKAIYCTETMRSIGRRWFINPPQQAAAVRAEQRRLLPGRNAFI